MIGWLLGHDMDCGVDGFSMTVTELIDADADVTQRLANVMCGPNTEEMKVFELDYAHCRQTKASSA